MKPVLLVTNHAPPARTLPFARLHEAEDVLVALYGGKSRHGGLPATAAAAAAEPRPFPTVGMSQRSVHALAASGRFRAVIAGLGGRAALPAAYAGARRAGVPFVLWASLWAHPRSPAHLASLPLTHALYRRADAIAAYGPHVARYVRAHGAGNVHLAPQAVDLGFWSAPVEAWREAEFQVMFAGRPDREKGVAVLHEAWLSAGFRAPRAALVLVGGHPTQSQVAAASAVVRVGPRPAAEVRNFYAGSDVVVIPSVPTATFREPWGLVANEAMSRAIPVIATEAVGAVAGGLVRHERNGLVVPAGDAGALAAALRRLHGDPGLRARLGAAAREDVAPYTPAAWAGGMSAALASVGASARGRDC